MTARRGQVALYLVAVLVGITLLVLMNVGAYLSVTAKNRAMNAGDAAALAVARLQGELLNRIGDLNLKHLNAVLECSINPSLDEEERFERIQRGSNECVRIQHDQARTCFLDPLEGIRIGNEWAWKNGIRISDDEAEHILRNHVSDIRTGYRYDLEHYPEPWEGAWEEYATRLELLLGNGVSAAPDNIDFIDASGGHFLLNAQFYNALAGHNWCWFHFNAVGLVDDYSSFTDWGPLPSADDATRRRRSVNSEIFSLHLMARQGSALSLFGAEAIKELTGCSDDDINSSVLVRDEGQVWYCHDVSDNGLWRKWWEIDPDPNFYNDGKGLPVIGKVKPEYDVRGCAAICRVMNKIPNVVFDGEDLINHWSASAKPFGQILDTDGQIPYLGLVRPLFTDVRLVPWDSVGGRDTERPNLSMVEHVRKHLPNYLHDGLIGLSSGCFYCDQLRNWERPSLHSEARNWLKLNSSTCIRAFNSGGSRGGTQHAH